MIKKFKVNTIRPFKYLFEVYNTDTNKVKYIIATSDNIQVDFDLNPKSNNIVQVYDNLGEALKTYDK